MLSTLIFEDVNLYTMLVNNHEEHHNIIIS